MIYLFRDYIRYFKKRNIIKGYLKVYILYYLVLFSASTILYTYKELKEELYK